MICHISTTDQEHWKRVAAYFKAGGRKSKQVGSAPMLSSDSRGTNRPRGRCATTWRP